MIGVVETGRAGKIAFGQGRLNVGEPMSPPLIRAAKRTRAKGAVTIFDAPPGTSCPVVATVRDADYVVLVTEPTPFGLNDLRLTVDLMRQLKQEFGVVINRAGIGNDAVRAFCMAECISVLAESPDDRRVAEAYSRGEMVIGSVPAFHAALSRLISQITTALSGKAPA